MAATPTGRRPARRIPATLSPHVYPSSRGPAPQRRSGMESGVQAKRWPGWLRSRPVNRSNRTRPVAVGVEAILPVAADLALTLTFAKNANVLALAGPASPSAQVE